MLILCLKKYNITFILCHVFNGAYVRKYIITVEKSIVNFRVGI